MENANEIWPTGKWRTARKPGRCDYKMTDGLCPHIIERGERYFDPGDSNPDKAGGFGGYRFCDKHFPLSRRRL